MSLFNRTRPIQLKNQYDLLVIGGGINGAAIAHVAALTGAKVCLLEKDDWASGTSSKSTKLLHGGIRYLENFEFDLVAESLKERFIQFKSVPYLVKPLRFIIPVYRHQGRPLWKLRLGVWLYDVLSGPYSLGSHSWLDVPQVQALAPSLKTEGLLGAVTYFDAQMDDSRIVLENVLMAQKHGADVYNHVEVREFIKKDAKAIGVRAHDFASGRTMDVMAEKVVVAAGPWTDRMRLKDSFDARLRLRPTKGVHLVCRGSIGNDAFLLQASNEKRIFFILPFGEQLLIGTTDTDFNGDPDDVKVENADIEYLLNEANINFPRLGLSRESIIASFAGLRPLVHEPKSPSKISRKHVIERLFTGVYYVMGGKYTTYRAIALEALSEILPAHFKRYNKSEVFNLYGSGLENDDLKDESRHYGLGIDTINHLRSVYGCRYKDVLALIGKDHSLSAPICSCSLTIKAQVVYAKEVEMALCFEDIYERRLNLGYNDCSTRACRQFIKLYMNNSCNSD